MRTCARFHLKANEFWNECQKCIMNKDNARKQFRSPFKWVDCFNQYWPNIAVAGSARYTYMYIACTNVSSHPAMFTDTKGNKSTCNYIRLYPVQIHSKSMLLFYMHHAKLVISFHLGVILIDQLSLPDWLSPAPHLSGISSPSTDASTGNTRTHIHRTN